MAEQMMVEPSPAAVAPLSVPLPPLPSPSAPPVGTPPSHEKEPADVCMLELLNIPRTMTDSCLSDPQIDTLFNLWKEFMVDRFQKGESTQQAREDVERLYSSATSVSRKYTALRLDQATSFGDTRTPALYAQEGQWIMGETSPTPFIAFLRQRPAVMEMLRMSFKPNLLHSGLLEAPDFLALLMRYVYWLKDDRNRTLNVLGVVDESASTGVTTEGMLRSLQTQWSNFRFHLAILNEANHWCAVLMDRVSHTFEYYDPLGRPLDIASPRTPLAEQVGQLYLATRNLDPSILTQSMHTVNRGFHKHQTGGTECGMYVVLFFHTRVAKLKTFEEFANMEIASQDCRHLKEAFFTLPGTLAPKPLSRSNKDYRLKFGDYDIRLAALEYVRYMSHVLNILQPSEAKTTVAQNQKRLLEMAVGGVDYVTIRVEGMRFQKDILNALPVHFKDYAGADIWFTIIQEVVQDPLTQHLRQISSGESARSKNTVRKKIALMIFSDVTGWSTKIGAPREPVQQLTLFMRQSLDAYYVPILRFDQDNHKRFEPGMQPTAYLRECMSRQETVSFGVHFLREVRNFVTNTLGLKVSSELTTKYAQKSTVVQPISAQNVEEIRTKINRCDQVMQQAYALLTSTFTDRMMITDQIRSGGKVAVDANSILASIPAQVQTVQPQVTDSIVQQIRKSMEDQTFLTHGIEPWNFPLNVAHYNANSGGDTLPEAFNLYSLNEADMKRLLATDLFRVYYAMELMIASHFISINQFGTDAATLRRNVSIVTFSVIQLLNVTEPFTENRKILCTILHRLFNALRAANRPELSDVLHMAGRYHQTCVSSNDVEETLDFFKRVNVAYQALTKG